MASFEHREVAELDVAAVLEGDGFVAYAGLFGLVHGVVAAGGARWLSGCGWGWRSRSCGCGGWAFGAEAAAGGPDVAGGRPGPAPKLRPLPQMRPGPVMATSWRSSPQMRELCQWLWP